MLHFCSKYGFNLFLIGYVYADFEFLFGGTCCEGSSGGSGPHAGSTSRGTPQFLLHYCGQVLLVMERKRRKRVKKRKKRQKRVQLLVKSSTLNQVPQNPQQQVPCLSICSLSKAKPRLLWLKLVALIQRKKKKGANNT